MDKLIFIHLFLMAFILLGSTDSSLMATSDTGDCAEYLDLEKNLQSNKDKCQDLVHDIPPGDEGCELRDRLAASFEHLACVFGSGNVSLINEESEDVEWIEVIGTLDNIQVEQELVGLTEKCLRQVSQVDPHQLEARTKEIFGIEDEYTEHRAEHSCWSDALNQVQSYVGITCLLEGVQKGFETACTEN